MNVTKHCKKITLVFVAGMFFLSCNVYAGAQEVSDTLRPVVGSAERVAEALPGVVDKEQKSSNENAKAYAALTGVLDGITTAIEAMQPLLAKTAEDLGDDDVVAMMELFGKEKDKAIKKALRALPLEEDMKKFQELDLLQTKVNMLRYRIVNLVNGVSLKYVYRKPNDKENYDETIIKMNEALQNLRNYVSSEMVESLEKLRFAQKQLFLRATGEITADIRIMLDTVRHDNPRRKNRQTVERVLNTFDTIPAPARTVDAAAALWGRDGYMQHLGEKWPVAGVVASKVMALQKSLKHLSKTINVETRTPSYIQDLEYALQICKNNLSKIKFAINDVKRWMNEQGEPERLSSNKQAEKIASGMGYEKIQYATLMAEEGITRPEVFIRTIETLLNSGVKTIRVIATGEDQMHSLWDKMTIETTQALAQRGVRFCKLDTEGLRMLRSAQEMYTDPELYNFVIENIHVFNIDESMENYKALRDAIEAGI